MSKAKTYKKQRPVVDVERAPGVARDVVAELAGVLKGSEIGDLREEYTEYLRKKYS